MGSRVGERRIGERSATTRSRRWRIRSLDDVALSGELDSLGLAGTVTGPEGIDVTLDSDQGAADLLRVLIEHDIAVVSCAPVESSLESTYFELTEPE